MVTFTTSVKAVTGLWEVRREVSGKAGTYWFGANPLNASSVSLSNKISVSGVAVSANVGTAGAGISISGSGSSVTMTSKKSNIWWQEHQHSGIRFKSNISILSTSEEATGTFVFGGKSFFHTIYA
jgi:hypothetical protein